MFMAVPSDPIATISDSYATPCRRRTTAMSSSRTSAIDLAAARRRRRGPRRVDLLDLFEPLPDTASAAAMDDPTEAERLIDDLAALVEAGLVVPIHGDGETRYAPADPFGDAA
jgi:hypothetical protein